MIPKKIHYCWFGKGEKSKIAKKCIESWHRYCPEYKFIEWNEDNFDINQLDYTKFTYENKMYAYLSDYVRLWAVSQYGGIYFDTDVELIKSPDEFLQKAAYFGFETKEYVNTGLGFGSEAHHPVIETMLQFYKDKKPEDYRTDYAKRGHITGSPRMNTYALISLGLKQNGEYQNICGAEILPQEYMCPYDDITGRLNCTSNTFSIHWYTKSANGKFAAVKSKFSRPMHRLLEKLGLMRRNQ